MTPKEKKWLFVKRAAASQHIEASNEGVDEVNDAHVIALKACDDLQKALEQLLKSLPRNSTVNKLLVQDALAGFRSVYADVQSLRKKEHKGNEH